MNAFQFGAYVKLALDMNAMGAGAAGGGAIGAGLGGLAGLINPGRDEQGNRKSRLMAALKGALGGGAVGAAGGAALGHFNPDMVNNMAGQARGMYNLGANKLQGLMGKKTPAAAPSNSAPQSLGELSAAVGHEPVESVVGRTPTSASSSISAQDVYNDMNNDVQSRIAQRQQQDQLRQAYGEEYMPQ